MLLDCLAIAVSVLLSAGIRNAWAITLGSSPAQGRLTLLETASRTNSQGVSPRWFFLVIVPRIRPGLATACNLDISAALLSQVLPAAPAPNTERTGPQPICQMEAGSLGAPLCLPNERWLLRSGLPSRRV